MTDLRTRFHSLDHLPVPDLWHEVEARGRAWTDQPFAARLERRAGVGSYPRRVSVPWALVAAALLVLAAIGGALAVGSGLLKLPFGVVASPSATPLANPSRAHLAYLLDGDIYLADWDGSNPVRIADGAPGFGCDSYFAEGPMWSPDGRYLAYRTLWRDQCRGMVYIHDARGHAVASFPGEGWHVEWSPDSTRVATWDSFYETIAIFGLDGERQALLSVPPDVMRRAQVGDFDPVWSPDGASLLIPPFEEPVDGSAIRRLAADDPLSHYFPFSAAVSPDGTLVAYWAKSWFSVSSLDGSQVRHLLSLADFELGPRNLAWSPSGDRIAFFARTAGSKEDELGSVDVASGTVTTLVGALGQSGGYSSALRFSPEGDRILFGRANDDATEYSLWSVNADGSGAQLLVAGTNMGDWQPFPQ